MGRKERKTVMGRSAPGPRPTAWAALLVAMFFSLALLLALGLWRLASALLG